MCVTKLHIFTEKGERKLTARTTCLCVSISQQHACNVCVCTLQLSLTCSFTVYSMRSRLQGSSGD